MWGLTEAIAKHGHLKQKQRGRRVFVGDRNRGLIGFKRDVERHGHECSTGSQRNILVVPGSNGIGQNTSAPHAQMQDVLEEHQKHPTDRESS